MKTFLIGKSLIHTFSPYLHSLMGNGDYGIKELREEELGAFFAERDFDGINVTVPYKEKVLEYVDVLSEEAKAVGAVNTVVNRNGVLYGYNTDVFGFEMLLLRFFGGEIPRGIRVAVLGTGGAAKSAVYVLKKYTDSVLTVSRTPGDGEISYAEIPHDTELIVNCTPVGMYPDTDGLPVAPDRFGELLGVIDVVYNPIRPRLVTEAEKMGIKACGGLYMLVCQGVKANRLFGGKEADCGAVYREIMKKQNIVLIGMPSCGKTTVGRLLAEMTGRELYDSDIIIENEEKMRISEIFAKKGEGYFRGLESEVIARLSEKADGKIIATGGGAVLDGKNTGRLRSNGTVIFIDRPLGELTLDGNRPLMKTAGDIERLYAGRLPIYCKAADFAVDGSGSAEEVAERILCLLKNR